MCAKLTTEQAFALLKANFAQAVSIVEEECVVLSREIKRALLRWRSR